jgi:serine/threonine-protein kinase
VQLLTYALYSLSIFSAYDGLPEEPVDLLEAIQVRVKSSYVPENGQVLPGYLLQEKIGEGGMGEVYRAWQPSRRRDVAIKFLKPLPGGEPGSVALLRESRLMAASVHPHVVEIYDSGEFEGCHYLVMEYVAGTTLRAEMEPGIAWSIERAWQVLDAISRALSSIHAQGILHLDLKPENVLCPYGGGLKITDFGVASAHGDARTLAALGRIRGTLDYCSPEQRHGLPQDERSDIFALAVLAYELLTGRVPGRAYLAVTEQEPQLPAEVDQVLPRGLCRDPDERYGSAEAFRCDLAAALQVESGPDPVVGTLAR